MSLFDHLKAGLARTHSQLVGRIEVLLGSSDLDLERDDDFLELLVSSDMGVGTATAILDALKARWRKGELRTREAFLSALRGELLAVLEKAEGGFPLPGKDDFRVFMFAGVNGSGKTTTIGKLGFRLAGQGFRVSFAAADTFRAGAVEQLRIWAGRSGSHLHAGDYGADPASVVFDAIRASRSRGDNLLLIDTAGRLHTSHNLMEELRKVHRTCDKAMEGAPHDVCLVLDATTGSNALQQARMFGAAINVTGVAVTKLDGTAKGGIIVSVARELGLPIRLVGCGESPEDLVDFRAAEFVRALFAS
jgi:fused signal recognition particle receptor